ncbi:cytochrome P450 [Suillus ampliporus]|nr:cytochrome P450 [Suillus ampliporus]
MPHTNIVLFFSAAAVVAGVLAKVLVTPKTRVHTSVQAIRTLLSPPDIPISALLRARSIPNQRLVKALGISSTFVSDDPDVHDDFTREAKTLITAVGTKDGWSRLVDVAETCVNKFLDTESLDYATFVQSVTFSVVLAGLLGTDIEDLVPADVAFVTEAINDRWAQSKGSSALPTEVLERINDHITRWVPDRTNPLNLIIPAYETMWRVAAIAVVYSNRDCLLRDAFLSYNENPTDDQFRALTTEGTGTRPSVEAVVSEVLRLYPPTRHITRSVDVPWWRRPFVPSVEVADVEEAQKSLLYGSDPESFNPMRFHASHSCPRRDQLYAFGHGKLKCVAASWAPSAAAVITAKIMAKLDDVAFTLIEGPSIGKRVGWEGWTIERI